MGDALITRRTISGGGSATIQALSVTANGTYTASGGVDGYSPVTVNVSGGGLSTTDAILRVTAPTGSTITATKNGVVLTPYIWTQNADNTLDTGLFIVSSSTFDSNAWTVTATLGADSTTISLAINTAAEYDVVMEYYPTGDLIPTMTSATTPSGEVTASSYVSGYNPYYAFDGDSSTKWYANSSGDRTARYLQYEFADDVKINSVELVLLNYSGSYSRTHTVTVYTSTDGTTFTSRYSESVTLAKGATETKTYVIDSGVCRYIRIGFSDLTASGGYYPSFMVVSAQASYN